MPELRREGPIGLVELLYEGGLVQSKSEARRLIRQGAVRVDGERIGAIDAVVGEGKHVIQVGKRRFLRVSLGA